MLRQLHCGFQVLHSGQWVDPGRVNQLTGGDPLARTLDVDLDGRGRSARDGDGAASGHVVGLVGLLQEDRDAGRRGGMRGEVLGLGRTMQGLGLKQEKTQL